MPKPKNRRAGARGRRPAGRGKGAAKGRRAKPKAAKPPVSKGRALAAKEPVRAARKPAAAMPRAAVAPPKPAPPLERKEATRMAGQNCPIHNSPDCYKPALDAYIQKAYDGYCTKIDWPYWRIIPKGWKPGK